MGAPEGTCFDKFEGSFSQPPTFVSDEAHSWQYMLSPSVCFGLQRRLSNVGVNPITSVGHCITTPSSPQYRLTALQLLLWKIRDPNVEVVTRIYEVSGTVGENAVPSGSSLAESDVVPTWEPHDDSVSRLRSGWGWMELGGVAYEHRFVFSGGNQITLQTDHDYAFSLEIKSGTLEPFLLVRSCLKSYTAHGFWTPHYGNCFFKQGNAWISDSLVDLYFYLYGVEV